MTTGCTGPSCPRCSGALIVYATCPGPAPVPDLPQAADTELLHRARRLVQEALADCVERARGMREAVAQGAGPTADAGRLRIAQSYDRDAEAWRLVLAALISGHQPAAFAAQRASAASPPAEDTWGRAAVLREVVVQAARAFVAASSTFAAEAADQVLIAAVRALDTIEPSEPVATVRFACPHVADCNSDTLTVLRDGTVWCPRHSAPSGIRGVDDVR
jgi:hypothetical protein